MLTKHPQVVYAGLTGAGRIKLGTTTCLEARERAFRCVDPDYCTLYTAPASDMSEQELLQLIRSFGFQYKRSREVFQVELSIVSDILAKRPPAGGRTARDILNALLTAELEPGFTVEQACYPTVEVIEWPAPPTSAQMAIGRRMLETAGLRYVEESFHLPGFVIIQDPTRFLVKFPELRHVVPFALYSKGVWVLSGGEPVEHKRPGFTAI